MARRTRCRRWHTTEARATAPLPLRRLPTVRSVVALAAHPDDIESWCAGTLALAVDAGARVELLIATSGEAGGSVSPTPALASVRESEARAAARVLGVGAPRFLRLRDGELEARATLTDACADFIREHRADLVLTFDPEQPWATSPHPDHVAIGRAGLSAAGVPVWCYSTAEPHFALDITTTYPRKLAAREEHRSQTADLRRLRADWQRRAEEIGQLCGVQFAEAFRLS